MLRSYLWAALLGALGCAGDPARKPDPTPDPDLLDASGGIDNPDGSMTFGDAAPTCVEAGVDIPEFELPACDAPSVTPDAGPPSQCDEALPEPRDVEPNESCAMQPADFTFSAVLEWERPSFGAVPTAQIQAQPVVASLSDDNGDGVIDSNDVPDIVVVAYGGSGDWGHVHAVSGEDGELLFSVTDIEAEIAAGVAAGDIDGDGIVELIVPARSGIYALEHDGSFKWQSWAITSHINGTADTASISDMDHDGSPEIIVGRAILSATGQLLGAGEHGMATKTDGFATCSFAADIDRDGEKEVIAGNAAYRRDGSTLWYTGTEDGFPAVGNFDDDDDGEVVVAGDGVLRLFDADGSPLWSEPIPGSSDPRFGGGGPPAIADFDGDGEAEIGVAATSLFSVFEGDGSVRWSRPISDLTSSAAGAAAFDFDGDGDSEVVYADEQALWVFDGRDGTVLLQRAEHVNGTIVEYPVIADVDGDGSAEIVTVQSDLTGSDLGGGIVVLGDPEDRWAPGRKIWNQHAYSISSVGDDGVIPNAATLDWLTSNSFRSGGGGSSAAAMQPDPSIEGGSLCERCGTLGFNGTVQVGNRGALATVAGAVRLEVFGEQSGQTRVLASAELEAIPAGRAIAGLPFVVSGSASSFDAIGVRVVSAEANCDSSNDVLRWTGPFCRVGVD